MPTRGASDVGRTGHRVGRSLPSNLVFGKRDGRAATGFGPACSRGTRACHLSDLDRKNRVFAMTYTRNAAPAAELQTPAGGSQHLARKYLQPVVALRHLGGGRCAKCHAARRGNQSYANAQMARGTGNRWITCVAKHGLERAERNRTSEGGKTSGRG
jgi:hypothetical protein